MDDDKFDLRDKLAIEILNAVLSSEKGNERVQDITIYLSSETKSWAEGAHERLDRLIRSCYKVADMMRKVRMSAFE